LVGGGGALDPPGQEAPALPKADGAPDRGEQNRRIALLPRLGIEAADNRLDGGDRAAGGADMADQARSEEGLADVGPGCGDEDSGHTRRFLEKSRILLPLATGLPPQGLNPLYLDSCFPVICSISIIAASLSCACNAGRLPSAKCVIASTIRGRRCATRSTRGLN